MFHGVLFSIGALLALILIILIFSHFDLLPEDSLPLKLLLISIALVIIALNSFLSSSSAALPACRNGFIVATNGSTGGANTCTPLVPDPLSGGGEGGLLPHPLTIRRGLGCGATPHGLSDPHTITWGSFGKLILN